VSAGASFTDKDGRRWTACCECNRGGRGNDKDKCSCGHKVTAPNGLGCFVGTPIVGKPRNPPKVSRGKARYRRYMEFCECFDSFLAFCYWDAEVQKRGRTV
jgi:hypothetical protein